MLLLRIGLLIGRCLLSVLTMLSLLVVLVTSGYSINLFLLWLLSVLTSLVVRLIILSGSFLLRLHKLVGICRENTLLRCVVNILQKFSSSGVVDLINTRSGSGRRHSHRSGNNILTVLSILMWLLLLLCSVVSCRNCAYIPLLCRNR